MRTILMRDQPRHRGLGTCFSPEMLTHTENFRKGGLKGDVWGQRHSQCLGKELCVWFFTEGVYGNGGLRVELSEQKKKKKCCAVSLFSPCSPYFLPFLLPFSCDF